jgi:hypothetical protein
MTVKFDKLAEGLGLGEEAREQITEAWQEKLNEAREEITAELREEFAQKFEHDKATLVKSVDRFITEKVKVELEEFSQDKKAIAEERVKAKRNMAKHAEMFESFITQTLAKEIRELREDRESSKANVQKLEEFVLKQLAEEVKEFHADKQALVEQRVKLVRESKRQITESKQAFIKKAATVIEGKISNVIETEIKQYRDDIEMARKNDFGRRIFEAFASEYMTSHLNESSEVKKIQQQMQSLTAKLQESQTQIKEQQTLLESEQRKVRAVKDQLGRDKVMNELVSPLAKSQRAIMVELLENVKTANLRESFNKYLPAVLNGNNTTHTNKQAITESVTSVKTGDRSASLTQQNDDAEYELEMNQLRKLAGISGQK